MRIRNAKELGLLIRDRRKRKRWSQGHLGNEIGASRSWVSDVERGKPKAEVELVLRALQALGLSLDVHERQHAERPAARVRMPVDSLVHATGRMGPSLTIRGKPLGAVRRGEGE